MKFNKKISFRMYLLLVFICIVLVITGLWGLKGMNDVNQSLETVYSDRVVPLEQLKTVSDMYAINIIGTAHKIQSGTITWTMGKNNITEAQDKIKKNWELFVSTEKTPEEKNFVTQAKPLLDQANESISYLLTLIEVQDREKVGQYVTNKLYLDIDPITAKINDLIGLQLEITHEEYNNNLAYYQQTRSITLGAIAISIILALAVSTLVIRSITRPVSKLQNQLNELADKGGDLTQEIDIKSHDEIGVLAGTVNKFLANIRNIIIEVRNSAGEVAETSQQLSSSSQQTTASANETASTMGEIASTVDNLSSNTQIISQAAQDVAGQAQEGNEGLTKVTDQIQIIARSTAEVSNTINSLSKKSTEINRIVDLINAIAEQTNLLALNAAIEAARAGEHGRGFAVVAEEVRNLAEQSASATREIYTLVKAIEDESEKAVKIMAEGNKQVENGTVIVQEVGTNLQDIITAIQGLTTQVQEVATAVEQMSGGVQNVAASAEEQTAAMQEVSASAEILSKLSYQLDSIVGKFKV